MAPVVFSAFEDGDAYDAEEDEEKGEEDDDVGEELEGLQQRVDQTLEGWYRMNAPQWLDDSEGPEELEVRKQREEL